MRRIILIIIASLMFANIGFAEMSFIEEKKIEADNLFIRITTVCIDGYKFVVATKTGKIERNIVQAFEERDGKSLPAKC
jgi:hypothetical protein